MKYIFTDGSCTRKFGGIGVYFNGENEIRISEPIEGETTNNRAELTAILRALELTNGYEDICICSDSKYSISCLTIWWNNWKKNGFRTANKKPVLNQDLLILIKDILDKRPTITFKHVLAHTGNTDTFSIGNCIADELATKASALAKLK